MGFAILPVTLSPTELGDALTELTGEVATGVVPTGIQAMDSFLTTTLSPKRIGRPPVPTIRRAPPPRIISDEYVFMDKLGGPQIRSQNGLECAPRTGQSFRA